MSTRAIPIRGGRIEIASLPGGPGTPLLVLGGLETGLRPLAGTENVLQRRWEARTAARTVHVVGRPIPDDPADADRLLHPRVSADAVASVLREEEIGPVAIEAESGGGRIGLWLTVDHPDLVERLVLSAVASETPAASPMAERLGAWIAMAEAGRWAEFFARMAQVMKPAGAAGGAEAFEREAETWVGLGLHPHVVSCYYVRRVDGVPRDRQVGGDEAEHGRHHGMDHPRSLGDGTDGDAAPSDLDP